MEKVAIITLQGRHNYGNRLQCYAVQESIRRHGFDTDVLEFLDTSIKTKAMNLYKKMKGQPLSPEETVSPQRSARFYAFNERITTRTIRLSDIGDASGYSRYVVGSDQVLNPFWMKNLDDPMFLQFTPPESRVLLSASLGVRDFPDKKRSWYTEGLRGFTHLSVREELGADMIKSLIGIRPTVLIDPTLSLSADEWLKVANDDFTPKKPYVLVYFLDEISATHEAFAHEMAAEHNADIIKVDSSGYGDFVPAGPAEFVSLIAHAQAVLTDSYHGCLFSCLFHTPVTIARRGGGRAFMFTRFETLMKKFPVFTQSPQGDYFVIDDTDAFSRFDSMLNTERESYEGYLERALTTHEGALHAGNGQGRPDAQTTRTRYPVTAVGEACCGCGACASVCPMGCLGMADDDCGFPRPVITAQTCTGCGLCQRVCPADGAHPMDEARSAWWAKALDSGLRARSSSGGVFGVLAQAVLAQGGVVYGCAFADDCKSAHHVRVCEEGQLGALLRSKYVQSRIAPDVYRKLEADLSGGLPVLWSGTPCQNAATSNLVKTRKLPTDSLLMVDVMCHGVPSPKLWEAWFDHLSNKQGRPIVDVSFRSKATGWPTYSILYEYETNGNEARSISMHPNKTDWYFLAFLRNASLRPSCLRCATKRRSGSDITLGDFWGIDALRPSTNDGLGVSAVICNTQKGEEALKAIASKFEMGPSDYEAIAAYNPVLTQAVKAKPEYEGFLPALAQGASIQKLMRRWSFKPPLSVRMRTTVGKLAWPVAQRLGEYAHGIRAKREGVQPDEDNGKS